jgi:hypothetical protein
MNFTFFSFIYLSMVKIIMNFLILKNLVNYSNLASTCGFLVQSLMYYTMRAQLFLHNLDF